MKKHSILTTFPPCDVAGCRETAICGGPAWKEAGYWNTCYDHTCISDNGGAMPKMKPSAVRREKSRDENGRLP